MYVLGWGLLSIDFFRSPLALGIRREPGDLEVITKDAGGLGFRV